jgi:hypothetical protein
MPSIEADYPMTGSNVPPVFTAFGTYANGNLANIRCKLVTAAGAVLKDLPATAGSNPGTDWKVDFDLSALPLPMAGLTLRPEITGPPDDSNDQPDITVEGAPPMLINPLPVPPPSPIPPPAPAPGVPTAVVTITVTGTHAAAVKEILCVALRYKDKVGETPPIGTAVAALNTPAAGQWTADITLSKKFPPGWKLAVFAQAKDAAGTIVARAHRRRS